MADLSESDFLKVLLGFALIANVVLFSYLYLGIVPYSGGLGFRPCQPIVVYANEDSCVEGNIIAPSECRAGFSSLPERKRANAAVEALAFHLRLSRRPPPSSLLVKDQLARLDDGSLIHLNETCNSKQMVTEGRAVAQLRHHKHLYANRGQR